MDIFDKASIEGSVSYPVRVSCGKASDGAIFFP